MAGPMQRVLWSVPIELTVARTSRRLLLCECLVCGCCSAVIIIIITTTTIIVIVIYSH